MANDQMANDQMANDRAVDDCCLIFFIVLLPPVGVGVMRGCNGDLCLNL